MKKIIAIFLVSVLLIAFSVGACAEIVVDDNWIFDMIHNYVSGSAHIEATPEYTNTNNSSVAFYISDTGKANVTYTVSLKSGSAVRATAEIYLEKHLIGPFWQRLDIKWTDTFTEKYHAKSFTADVNESGLYRVTIKVTAGKDKIKTSASFEYEKGTMLGDVNSDGKITAGDARTVLRYSAKLEKYSLSTEKRGDINRDGSITASDARLILKISTMRL